MTKDEAARALLADSLKATAPAPPAAPKRPQDEIPRFANGTPRRELDRLREALCGGAWDPDFFREVVLREHYEANRDAIIRLWRLEEREAARQAEETAAAIPPPLAEGDDPLAALAEGRLSLVDYEKHRGEIIAARKSAAIEAEITRLERSRERLGTPEPKTE